MSSNTNSGVPGRVGHCNTSLLQIISFAHFRPLSTFDFHFYLPPLPCSPWSSRPSSALGQVGGTHRPPLPSRSLRWASHSSAILAHDHGGPKATATTALTLPVRHDSPQSPWRTLRGHSCSICTRTARRLFAFIHQLQLAPAS